MITIDWGTKVILVPRTDLPLTQSNPTEIRDMDLNWFRMQLKDLEDSEAGMVNPDTHKHNTEVFLGGLTYARVIEIINDYTITFEDGQYGVNLSGANSNVIDRVNVNQVSVRSANSAGMTSPTGILDTEIESGYTFENVLKIIASAVGGKLSGADGTTITIRNLGDTKDVIVANVDGNGNRTGVNYDVS